MQAAVGDRLHVRGNSVGTPDRTGEIVEVRDANGEPPYLVRFDDGHTSLVFPGPDAVVEHPAKKPGPARQQRKTSKTTKTTKAPKATGAPKAAKAKA